MNGPAAYIRENQGAAESFRARVAGVYRYRFALWNLVLKDFRVRYRNMSLGFLWSLLNPLVMLGVMVIVFSYIHPSRHAVHFPIFLLLGMVIYNYFSLCMPPATQSILDNAALVKKVTFPRELMPISVVLSQGIHVLIQLALVGVFLGVFRIPPRAAWLLVPCYFFVEFLFITGAALACSALNVFYRDILYIVQSLLTVFFWLTPVFYDLPQVKMNLPPFLYRIYILNPLAGLIDATRRAVLSGRGPDPESFGMALAVTGLVCLLGVKLFHSRQAYFADKI
jgi:ABC-type polysaccharide/polyol phosphate export permease